MDDQQLKQTLADLQEQQKFILVELKKNTRPRKDAWDKLQCVAPVLSGLLIGGCGGFIGYTYNQQQIKLQEAETIERFIPHLAGNEKTKKAAILAMSSLTNTELAAKMASLFASEGTVSALESIAQAGNTKDRTVATEALAKAFGSMAQRSLDENNIELAESQLQRAIAIREKLDGVNSPTLCDNLDRLGDLYEAQGKRTLAEPLLRRSLKLRQANGDASSPEALLSTGKLADLLEQGGRTKEARILRNSVKPTNDSALAEEIKSAEKNATERGNTDNGAVSNLSEQQATIDNEKTSSLDSGKPRINAQGESELPGSNPDASKDRRTVAPVPAASATNQITR